MDVKLAGTLNQRTVKQYRNLLGAALIFAMALSSCTTQKESTTADASSEEVSDIPNSLTPEQTADGWRLLFDGENIGQMMFRDAFEMYFCFF